MLAPDRLRVPFARVGDALVRPSDFATGAEARCPGCDGLLRLRSSAHAQAHFAHVVATPTCRLAGEGWLHFWTKLTIYEAVRRHVAGVEPMVFIQACGSCSVALTPTPLPASVDDASVEVIDGPSARVVDVGLMREGRLIAGIEVCDTNPVSLSKAHELSVPWYEVEAGAAAIENGHLRIARSFPLRRCAECNQRAAQPQVRYEPPSESRPLSRPPLLTSTRRQNVARDDLRRSPRLRVWYDAIDPQTLEFSVVCPKAKQRTDPYRSCAPCPHLLQVYEEPLRVRGAPPGEHYGARMVRCGYGRGRTQDDYPELDRFFRSMLRHFTQDDFLPEEGPEDANKSDLDDDDQLWDEHL